MFSEADTRPVFRTFVAMCLCIVCLTFGAGFAIGHFLYSRPSPAENTEHSLPPLRAEMWVMADLPGFGVQRCQIEEVAGDWMRVTSGGFYDLWIHRSRVRDMAPAPQNPRRPNTRPSGSQTGSGTEVGALE